MCPRRFGRRGGGAHRFTVGRVRRRLPCRAYQQAVRLEPYFVVTGCMFVGSVTRGSGRGRAAVSGRADALIAEPFERRCRVGLPSRVRENRVEAGHEMNVAGLEFDGLRTSLRIEFATGSCMEKSRRRVPEISSRRVEAWAAFIIPSEDSSTCTNDRDSG